MKYVFLLRMEVIYIRACFMRSLSVEISRERLIMSIIAFLHPRFELHVSLVILKFI